MHEIWTLLQNGWPHGIRDVAILFQEEFYLRTLHICVNFCVAQIREKALTIVREFFLVNLRKSINFEETAVMGVFVVAKIDSVHKF